MKFLLKLFFHTKTHQFVGLLFSSMDYELNYVNEYSVISAVNGSSEIKNAFNPVVYDKVFYRKTRVDIIFKFILIKSLLREHIFYI